MLITTLFMFILLTIRWTGLQPQANSSDRPTRISELYLCIVCSSEFRRAGDCTKYAVRDPKTKNIGASPDLFPKGDGEDTHLKPYLQSLAIIEPRLEAPPFLVVLVRPRCYIVNVQMWKIVFLM